MSKSLNRAEVIGNLGNDPDMHYAPDGSCIMKLSVATSESWTDKNTQQLREKTEWHNVVVFGKIAEAVHQYLHKGSKVFVEGKLQTNKWQDKETGKDCYRTDIAVDGFHGRLIMLDKNPNQPQQQGQHQQQQGQGSQHPARQPPQQPYQQGKQQQQPQQQNGWNNRK